MDFIFPEKSLEVVLLRGRGIREPTKKGKRILRCKGGSYSRDPILIYKLLTTGGGRIPNANEKGGREVPVGRPTCLLFLKISLLKRRPIQFQNTGEEPMSDQP